MTDAAEVEYVASLPLSGLTVADVGARGGSMTTVFAAAVGPHGSVIAYEPDPANGAELRARIAAEGLVNVTVRPLALADGPGPLEFAYPADRGLGSAESAIRDALRAGGAATVTLPATTLDADVAAGLAPAPDLVKIDVEGLEAAVLRGMAELLAARRPQVLIEIHGADRERKEASARETISLLECAGYAVRHVESGRELTPAEADHATEGHLHGRPTIAAA